MVYEWRIQYLILQMSPRLTSSISLIDWGLGEYSSNAGLSIIFKFSSVCWWH